MTSPDFKITHSKDFEAEHLVKTESLSFRMLTKNEWNNMFYKHLDHYLTQFGV